MTISRLAIIGGGAWGTALAQAAALAGREIVLIVRSPETATRINTNRENATHLPGIALSSAITASASPQDIEAADAVLVVVPAQTTRSALNWVEPNRLAGKPVILCAKGLETATLDRQSQILAGTAPNAVPLVLSGPSFAHDVAAGRPTAVTLAANEAPLCDMVARALSGPTFRLYTSSDLIGVELAGALKNVYALACGAVEGAGLGLSARSALIARAYAELSRLVAAMGGTPATLTGLAGLGDLTLSCTTPQSRNYAFGLALGKGLSPTEIETRQNGLAEGVKTAPVAAGLARQHGVDVPLIDAVNLLLAGNIGIDEIVGQLMTRPLKRESET